jgi:uncharacterized protein (TIGR00106 family)
MKRQVVAEVSIIPIGTADAGISQFVAASLRVLEERKGLAYRLTPMGTIIEGPLDKVLEAICDMHEVPFSKGAERVVTSIKIDDRRDKPTTMDGKLESVRKLRPSINT